MAPHGPMGCGHDEGPLRIKVKSGTRAGGAEANVDLLLNPHPLGPQILAAYFKINLCLEKRGYFRA